MADKIQTVIEDKALVRRTIDMTMIFSDYFNDLLEEIVVDSMIEDRGNTVSGESAAGETFARRVDKLAEDVRVRVVDVMCARARELATQMIMRDPECAIVKREAELERLGGGK
ncbi:MAG: hypothetical protein AB7F40_04410 [Victivallaceae bacterium]